MNYTKLAAEVRRLYHAFRNAYFTDSESFELTKFCVKEFSIFREMIEEDCEDCV